MSSSNSFPSLRAGLCVAALLLSSCGGGGGGGGNNGNAGGGGQSLSLSVSSVTCTSFQNDFSPDNHDVLVSWTNSKVAGFAVGTLPGVAVPDWLTAEMEGTVVKLHCTAGNIAPGRYSLTLRFITGDLTQKILAQKDIPVTFDVVAEPVVNAAVSTWVETERASNSTLTVTPGTGISVYSVSTDVPWMSASLSGNTITLTGTAESAGLTPGNYLGALHTTVEYGARRHTVVSALAGTVTRALMGPASLSIVIDADTVRADLTAHTATITTATVLQTGFTVESDLDWVSASRGVTGVPDNLKLKVAGTGYGLMPWGSNPGVLRIIPDNGAQPLDIPVVVEMRLPDVHYVAPVAFTDTLATDYVVVRGGGFTSPGFKLRVDGVPVANPQLINDTEVRFVPGPLTVGDHVVNADNALGADRASAMLRVVDPPPYHDALVPADIGPQDRVVSSPINGAVFASRSYFTESYANPPVGDASVINRFAYDAGTQLWTRTQHAYPELFDFALSPDESQLLVLTHNDLRIVDPRSMQTLDSVPLPRSVEGLARQLGVLNNGLVYVDAAHLVFSLRERSWQDSAFYETDGGMAVSRDGGFAIVGRSGSPYSYINASTNALEPAPSSQAFFCCGAVSRHGQVALINEFVTQVDGAALGTLPTTGFLGDLSPDGHRAYGHDFQSGALRVFDLTTSPTFTELSPIPYPPQVAGDIGMIATDPAGRVVFKITDRYFVVTELP